MKSILEISAKVKKEADRLLKEYKIVDILTKFGEVKFTGSYELDLMLKKDIDISLINDSLSVSDFTRLGKELIDRLNTPSVYYRNTRITPMEKRPENSLYWGVQTGEWFLDIWAMENSVYKRAEIYISRIKSLLTYEKKINILELKNILLKEGRYGKGISSRELYDAVLIENVQSIEQFNEYLKSGDIKNQYI